MAEGVKLYSQETWKRVTEGRGVAMVEENLEAVVEYYISQSEGANHAVREAACACIAELGTKVTSCHSDSKDKNITIIYNFSVCMYGYIFTISSQTIWPIRLKFSGDSGGYHGVVWREFGEIRIKTMPIGLKKKTKK